MADYFTNFCLVMPLPDEAAQKYALALASAASNAQLGDEPHEPLPDSIKEVIEDWQFNTEPESNGICLHSQYGGIDAVCAFIQHLLQKFNPPGCVKFEWSHDCSKQRVDAYGGGAAIITAQEIKTINTGEWLHQNATSH